MLELLILTGACGVGKSTISKKWAKLKSGAVVESDYFTEWIFNNKFERFAAEEEAFVANMTFVAAQEYMRQDMSVAIENVWTPAGLQLLIKLFEEGSADVSIKIVWLKCETGENHRRDEQRVPEDQMKERVDIVHAELCGYHWPEYVNIIDSTELSEQQTLDVIESITNTIVV